MMPGAQGAGFHSFLQSPDGNCFGELQANKALWNNADSACASDVASAGVRGAETEVNGSFFRHAAQPIGASTSLGISMYSAGNMATVYPVASPPEALLRTDVDRAGGLASSSNGKPPLSTFTPRAQKVPLPDQSVFDSGAVLARSGGPGHHRSPSSRVAQVPPTPARTPAWAASGDGKRRGSRLSNRLQRHDSLTDTKVLMELMEDGTVMDYSGHGPAVLSMGPGPGTAANVLAGGRRGSTTGHLPISSPEYQGQGLTLEELESDGAAVDAANASNGAAAGAPAAPRAPGAFGVAVRRPRAQLDASGADGMAVDAGSTAGLPPARSRRGSLPTQTATAAPAMPGAAAGAFGGVALRPFTSGAAAAGSSSGPAPSGLPSFPVSLAARRASVPSVPISFDRDFTVTRTLGVGSFSKVLEVVSKADGQRYAVKKALKKMKSRRDRDLGLREFRAAMKVGPHPCLVRYRRAWQENGHLFFQTELCPGGTVRDAVGRIPTTVPVPERTAWSLIACVSAALAHMHKAGWIHLDVKLDNVLMDATGWLKLGDLGIAGEYRRAQLSPSSNSTASMIVGRRGSTASSAMGGQSGLGHHGDTDGSRDESHDQDASEQDVSYGQRSGMGADGAVDSDEIIAMAPGGRFSDVVSDTADEEGDSRYMAPELLAPGGRAPPADIFSLGITAYELVWDTPAPVEGVAWQDIRQGRVPAPSPAVYRSDTIVQVVLAMLHPDPQARPTAQQILALPQCQAALQQPDALLLGHVLSLGRGSSSPRSQGLAAQADRRASMTAPVPLDPAQITGGYNLAGVTASDLQELSKGRVPLVHAGQTVVVQLEGLGSPSASKDKDRGADAQGPFSHATDGPSFGGVGLAGGPGLTGYTLGRSASLREDEVTDFIHAGEAAMAHAHAATANGAGAAATGGAVGAGSDQAMDQDAVASRGEDHDSIGEPVWSAGSPDFSGSGRRGVTRAAHATQSRMRTSTQSSLDSIFGTETGHGLAAALAAAGPAAQSSHSLSRPSSTSSWPVQALQMDSARTPPMAPLERMQTFRFVAADAATFALPPAAEAGGASRDGVAVSRPESTDLHEDEADDGDAMAIGPIGLAGPSAMHAGGLPSAVSGHFPSSVLASTRVAIPTARRGDGTGPAGASAALRARVARAIDFDSESSDESPDTSFSKDVNNTTVDTTMSEAEGGAGLGARARTGPVFGRMSPADNGAGASAGAQPLFQPPTLTLGMEAQPASWQMPQQQQQQQQLPSAMPMTSTIAGAHYGQGQAQAPVAGAWRAPQPSAMPTMASIAARRLGDMGGSASVSLPSARKHPRNYDKQPQDGYGRSLFAAGAGPAEQGPAFVSPHRGVASGLPSAEFTMGSLLGNMPHATPARIARARRRATAASNNNIAGGASAVPPLPVGQPLSFGPGPSEPFMPFSQGSLAYSQDSNDGDQSQVLSQGGMFMSQETAGRQGEAASASGSLSSRTDGSSTSASSGVAMPMSHMGIGMAGVAGQPGGVAYGLMAALPAPVAGTMGPPPLPPRHWQHQVGHAASGPSGPVSGVFALSSPAKLFPIGGARAQGAIQPGGQGPVPIPPASPADTETVTPNAKRAHTGPSPSSDAMMTAGSSDGAESMASQGLGLGPTALGGAGQGVDGHEVGQDGGVGNALSISFLLRGGSHADARVGPGSDGIAGALFGPEGGEQQYHARQYGRQEENKENNPVQGQRGGYSHLHLVEDDDDEFGLQAEQSQPTVEERLQNQAMGPPPLPGHRGAEPVGMRVAFQPVPQPMASHLTAAAQQHQQQQQLQAYHAMHMATPAVSSRYGGHGYGMAGGMQHGQQADGRGMPHPDAMDTSKPMDRHVQLAGPGMDGTAPQRLHWPFMSGAQDHGSSAPVPMSISATVMAPRPGPRIVPGMEFPRPPPALAPGHGAGQGRLSLGHMNVDGPSAGMAGAGQSSHGQYLLDASSSSGVSAMSDEGMAMTAARPTYGQGSRRGRDSMDGVSQGHGQGVGASAYAGPSGLQFNLGPGSPLPDISSPVGTRASPGLSPMLQPAGRFPVGPNGRGAVVRGSPAEITGRSNAAPTKPPAVRGAPQKSRPAGGRLRSGTQGSSDGEPGLAAPRALALPSAMASSAFHGPEGQSEGVLGHVGGAFTGAGSFPGRRYAASMRMAEHGGPGMGMDAAAAANPGGLHSALLHRPLSQPIPEGQPVFEDGPGPGEVAFVAPGRLAFARPPSASDASSSSIGQSGAMSNGTTTPAAGDGDTTPANQMITLNALHWASNV